MDIKFKIGDKFYYTRRDMFGSVEVKLDTVTRITVTETRAEYNDSLRENQMYLDPELAREAALKEAKKHYEQNASNLRLKRLEKIGDE